MNWALFFAPIIKVLAEGLVKLIYDLVEKWAANQKEKPPSEAKKAKAHHIAYSMVADLNEEQIDAAIEMVHVASETLPGRGKAAKG